jgi:hypothetical protein
MLLSAGAGISIHCPIRSGFKSFSIVAFGARPPDAANNEEDDR